MFACTECLREVRSDLPMCVFCGMERPEEGWGPEPLLGRQLGAYRVESRIGIGGMGTVYRGTRTDLKSTVAIKVMHPYMATPLAARRFVREAQIAAQLESPYAVRILDFGETEDGWLYIVMEHLSGETLADVLARGPIPAERALSIVEQLCDALGEAHAAGIVHRDLKPQNVMLLSGRRGDFVKLLDFGIAWAEQLGGASMARLTQSGMVQGTPHYMAPEQVTQANVDRRADLYALGAILFQMLTGRVPFDAPTAVETMAMQVNAPLPELEAAAPLQKLVRRLLAKDRTCRPADVNAVLTEISTIRPALGDAAPAPTRRGMRWAIWLTVAAALAASAWWLAPAGTAPTVPLLPLSLPSLPPPEATAAPPLPMPRRAPALASRLARAGPDELAPKAALDLRAIPDFPGREALMRHLDKLARLGQSADEIGCRTDPPRDLHEGWRWCTLEKRPRASVRLELLDGRAFALKVAYRVREESEMDGVERWLGTRLGPKSAQGRDVDGVTWRQWVDGRFVVVFRRRKARRSLTVRDVSRQAVFRARHRVWLDARDLNDRGIVALKARPPRVEEAIALLAAARERVPGYTDPTVNLCWAHYLAGRPARALGHCKLGERSAMPRVRAEAAYWRGAMAASTGDRAAAVRWYTRALRHRHSFRGSARTRLSGLNGRLAVSVLRTEYAAAACLGRAGSPKAADRLAREFGFANLTAMARAAHGGKVPKLRCR